jgi:hypothetical protein
MGMCRDPNVIKFGEIQLLTDWGIFEHME